jgi:acyl-CoA reductase-like NAD-dependent aldehyde dehydrogenase
VTGTLAIPEAAHQIPDTPKEDLDRMVHSLAGARRRWEATPIGVRVAMLEAAMKDTHSVAGDWVEAACRAKGIRPNKPEAGQEWQGGPALLIRNLRLLARTLRSIEAKGHPPVGRLTTRADGTLAVAVFPTDMMDRALYAGIRGEVWLPPQVTKDNLFEHMAAAYRRPTSASVCVVLGAGNISSIAPMDALYKLVVENRVVALKLNPVSAYLGPFLERALKVFIDAGFLAIAQGGAEVGEYLITRDVVETIHITGSDKSHDAIVFGGGEEGAVRKQHGQPRLDKPITSELGNVTPVIVVPGPWSDSDLRHQAENLASGLTHNAGFNCIANRVLITHASWDLRQPLIDGIRAKLDRIPSREAYYPGALDRLQAYIETVESEPTRHGKTSGNAPGWTLLAGTPPENTSAFQTECFAPAFVETGIEAPSPIEFLERAVGFCNDTVWGTLGAGIVVHPESMKDPAMAAAVDRAIADLRYGTVAVNLWPAVTYAMVTTPWGAYPGHTFQSIGSGRGVVHNALMFDAPLKAVAIGPFRSLLKPPWFGTHRTAHRTLAALTDLEAQGGVGPLVRTAVHAVRG